MKFDLDQLLEAAKEAQLMSYSPYSHFPVGAAVYTSDGRMFVGANVENASYGLSVCAERNAIMQAVLAGAKEIVHMAIVTNASPPALSCGMCLQVTAEFSKDCKIISANPRGEVTHTSLAELFPSRFTFQKEASIRKE